MAFVDEWLAQPYVRAVSAGEGHWTILRKLLRESGTVGNLLSDAHLAAIALELGASVCSTDGDFERFLASIASTRCVRPLPKKPLPSRPRP